MEILENQVKVLILTVALLATTAIAGNYVNYGHFQSGYFDDMAWTSDGYLDRYMSEQWVNWPVNRTITNIGQAVVDNQPYEQYEFTVPEPATILILISGIYYLKGKRNDK